MKNDDNIPGPGTYDPSHLTNSLKDNPKILGIIGKDKKDQNLLSDNPAPNAYFEDWNYADL